MRRYEGNRSVRTLAYSPCSRFLAAGGFKHVCVWNLSAGTGHDLTPAPDGYAVSVDFSPDGVRLAWVAQSGNNLALNLFGCVVSDGTSSKPARQLHSTALAVGFLPTGEWVAVKPRGLIAGDFDGRTRACTVRGPDSPMAVSSAGIVAVARPCGPGAVGLFDGHLRAVSELIGPAWATDPTSFNEDGTLMAQASPDNIAPLKTLAFSPDGRLLAGVGTGGLVVWDVPLRTPSFLASDTRLTAAAFTPDGRWLLAGGHTTEIQAWRTDCWQMHPWLDWQVGWIDALAVSPDGTTAAAAGWNGQIVVWDLDL